MLAAVAAEAVEAARQSADGYAVAVVEHAVALCGVLDKWDEEHDSDYAGPVTSWRDVTDIQDNLRRAVKARQAARGGE